MYSIGQLAKLSKTTVRTLLYYDEIGLLKPSNLSEGGHRYYDEQDVETLHNILTLKELGFELETIKGILLDQSKSSRELLEMRLEMIQQEQEQLNNKKQKIKAFLQLIDLEGRYDWENIFQSFTKYKYTYQEIEQHQRKIFTEEEMEIIQKLPKVGDDNELNARFVELMKEARTLVNHNPDSNEAQNLADKLYQLAEEMYQGNWQLYKKLANLDPKNREKIGFFKFEPTVAEFLNETFKVYMKRKQRSEKV